MINHDIAVCGKIKSKTKGSPIIGYIIKIHKYSTEGLCISPDTMKWLIANKYVKAITNSGNIVSFTDFKEFNNIKIEDTELNDMLLSGESIIDIIQKCRIPKIARKRSQAELEAIAKQKNSQRKEKNCYMASIDTNYPHVIKIIRATGINLEIAGYEIVYRDKIYTVTKQYALQLGKEYKLKNARYSYNGTIESLNMAGGNRNILDVILTPDTQLLDSVKVLDEYVTLEEIPARIMGCIFNQINSLIGIKVMILGKEYNIKLDQLTELIRRYSLALNKTLSEEEYEKLKTLYNVFIRKLHGQKLYRYIRIISPFMTKEVSEYLYGIENTLIVGDGIDYGDIGLRNKVLAQASEIEHSLIRGQRGIQISKKEIKVVARVETGDFLSKRFKATYTNYIVEHRGNYYVVGKGQLLHFNTENVDKFIVLWHSELRHRFYSDGGYIIAGLNTINKQAKREIENDRDIK